MFDVGGHLDELRSWPTARLRARHEHLVAEQRRLHVEDLDVLRVLDERGAIDEAQAGRDGVSARTLRETLETARALESLPAVAAAHAGALSAEQLAPVVALADESSDAEWAARAVHTTPRDLARLARCQRTPTVEDGRARQAARGMRMWWQPGRGMLQFRGELPDVDGARFEAEINRRTERMRPPKGQPWDTRDHRNADALLALCDEAANPEASEAPVPAPKPLLVVAVMGTVASPAVNTATASRSTTCDPDPGEEPTTSPISPR